VNDVSLIASVAVASVLAIAGIGKMLFANGPMDRPLALVELILSAVLLMPSWRLWTMLAATFLSVAFVVHAFRTRQQVCYCFGRALPTTQIAGQRWRNISLLVISLSGVITALRTPLAITTPVFDYGAGILLGVITVGSPWLIDLVSRSTLDRTDELAT
jgi:hypothetical protein